MNFIVKPSLSRRALVRIVVALWFHIIDCIAKSSIKFRTLAWRDNKDNETIKEWKKQEKKVNESVAKLPLPKHLKMEVLNIVKPIGLEIMKWKELHEEFFQNSNVEVSSILKCLRWKLQGTVDEKKTAEAIIENHCLHTSKSFELACVYCLESHILVLWNELQQHERVIYSSDFVLDENNALVCYWSHVMKNEVHRMRNMILRSWRDYPCSPHQFAFEYAAAFHYKTAAQYFLQKLNPDERAESLVRYTKYVVIRHLGIEDDCELFNRYYARSEYVADVFCFLLSQLSEEQQIQIFQECPYNVLGCLLVWPFQGFILETQKHVHGLLREQRFGEILKEIAVKELLGYRDFSYRELFEIIWNSGSIAHKKYVRSVCRNGCLTQDLFELGDRRLVNLVWKEATVEEKLTFIYDYGGNFLIGDLIHDDEWDLFEFLIKGYIPSSCRIQFAEHFKKVLLSRVGYARWNKKEMLKKWNIYLGVLKFFNEHEFKASTADEGGGVVADFHFHTPIGEKRVIVKM